MSGTTIIAQISIPLKGELGDVFATTECESKTKLISEIFASMIGKGDYKSI